MKSQKRHVNYIYFGLLFLCLSFIHVYQIFLIENGSFLHRCFYIIYAIGQCFLEVGALVVIGNYLVKRFPRSLNPVFILLTFILLMIHVVDFPIVRIMDMSIWYVLDWISQESFENFIELLYASNVSITTWFIFGIVAFLLPILGLIFFSLTNLIAKKKPLNFSYPTAGLSLMAIVLFLSMFDFKTCKLAAPAEDGSYLKALPWKTTLFSTPHPILTLNQTLKSMPNEKEVLDAISANSNIPLRKPNIFLFVIESLREDYLTPDVAPTFSRLAEENISVDLSFSSSNATSNSWFSLFYAKCPLYWGLMKPPQWNSGSVPLRILKNAGYKIHIYSAARLGFYQMDEILLGSDLSLADSLDFYTHDGTIESYESDKSCFEKMLQDMSERSGEEGHLHIVFLESTHFDYSWPKRDSLQFTPIDDQVNYFKVACSNENIEGIKNRYRNAIFYLDSLFGDFYNRLQMHDNGDESVIVITGDHGEEFFEEGHIFHASNLSPMQTRVPIYYKLGKSNFMPVKTSLTSHIDIFPTIFHYLYGEEVFANLFDGESIFKENRRSFVVTARYNWSRSPYEFFIHNGKHKLVARFLNKRNIFQSRALQIMSKKDLGNASISFDLPSIQVEFGEAIDYLFPQK